MCLFVGKPQKFILNWVGVGVRVHKRRKLEWVIIKSKEIPNLPSDLSRIRIRPRASVGVGIIIIIYRRYLNGVSKKDVHTPLSFDVQG